MTDDASFFLNVGAAPANPLLPHQLILALTDGADPLFTLQNTFHWIKSITIETRANEQISAGHFKPINSKRYVNDCHEYVFHLTKTGDVQLDRRAAGVPYQDKSNIARWGHTGGADLRCRGNTWFIPYETINSRDKDRPHPATFPVALVEQCIRLHGKGPATRLLDPFLGIGTSAIAAHRQGIDRFHRHRAGRPLPRNRPRTPRRRNHPPARKNCRSEPEGRRQRHHRATYAGSNFTGLTPGRADHPPL